MELHAFAESIKVLVTCEISLGGQHARKIRYDLAFL